MLSLYPEMEQGSHSSFYVAPLHIVKSTTDLTAWRSDTSSPSVGADLPVKDQITAPTTPHDADQMSVEVDEPARSTFHNYLRAFYPFHPTASVSPSTVTLPLNAGNIVLVHSIHTNGWADGTLLDTGARGWLPTNYCEAYEHIPMRPLLKALTDFWDLIRNRNDATLAIFRNQDYMRGLIAGVRFLLEKSDCLTRDSSIVKNHDNIRRARKALLSDLSSLVKLAKVLQDAASVAPSDRSVDEVFSQMLLKAFKVVTRGVKFLDVWNEDAGANRDIESVSAILERAKSQDRSRPLNPAHTTPINMEEEDKSIETIRQQPRHSKELRKSKFRPRISREMASSPPDVGESPDQDRRISVYNRRTSVSHRMTSGGHATGPTNFKLASERLRSSHDTFLGCLGTFLGLHMQSRSSSELLLTTQQSVKSCRELLTIIEVVLDHDICQAENLADAKDAMYDNITELVHAAREVFRPVVSADEDMVFMPDQGKRLVNAARDCVRGAGECVAMTRSVLQRIGDFEPEAAELQSSTITIGSPRSSRQMDMDSEMPNAECEEEQSTAGETEEGSTIDEPEERYLPRLEIPIISPTSPLSSAFNFTASPSNLVPDATTIGSADIVSPGSLPAPSAVGTPAFLENDLANLSSADPALSNPLPEGYCSARAIVSSTDSSGTYISSGRDSQMSAHSQTSTRATSPAGLSQHREVDGLEHRLSGSHTISADECDETEAKVMEKTFAHELMYNKDGQTIGGTLSALIEKLTAHHSTPDALFVSTFYLTFRLFASPHDFAEALAYRFNYIGETPNVAGPVRLRVYNVFKGWLESHWRHDCDDVALPFILDFARNTLTEVLPTAGKRLTELAEKVTDVHGPLVPRLVSSIGKTNLSTAPYVNPDTPVPAPIISKSQLLALKTWKNGGPNVSILDFDPLELARQITLKESSIFCSILPEELLATEWMKRSGSLAVNVRAMSTLSTDLANLVADSILLLEEPKKRAVLIKQWVKIANKCVELKNYDSLMAIICSLNSSTIARLKKTWELVSQKTKAILEELKKIVDVSRNYVVLRQRLHGHVPPCLPFVGIYLTDLTFVDHGNQTTRQLTTEEGSIGLINYDKHMKTAKIISELQRFQIPYRLAEIPELQTWMMHQLVRVRSGGDKSFQNYYRRSLILEPREQAQAQARTFPIGINPPGKSGEKGFDFLSWAHTNKDKSVATNG
jgi:RasGEF domain/RasGEF N-terminal motif